MYVLIEGHVGIEQGEELGVQPFPMEFLVEGGSATQVWPTLNLNISARWVSLRSIYNRSFGKLHLLAERKLDENSSKICGKNIFHDAASASSILGG